MGLEPGSTVSVQLKISGLPSGCEDTVTESAPIEDVPPVCSFDEWGNLDPNEVRGQLDIIFATLSNNPKDKGLFVIYVNEKETLEPSNKRLLLIVRHAKFRKFDLSRLISKMGRFEEHRTVFYRVPPDAEIPCPECIEYLGSSL